MLRRMLYLLPVLSIALATVLTSAQADSPPAKSEVVQTHEGIQSAEASRADERLLSEQEMARYKGGQGCFGLGSENCCEESKALGSVAAFGTAVAPNPWFATATMLVAIHQVFYC